MDYQAAAFWLSFANVIFTAAVGVYVRLSAKSQAKEVALTAFRADVDERLGDQNARIRMLESHSHPRCAIDVEECCSDLTGRISGVETGLKHAPTHDDLARLHARIDEVMSVTKRIEGENSAQTRILNLVYESLIHRSSQ